MTDTVALAETTSQSNRIVVLDTETTGLEVNLGHKIIEIGCVELIDRRPTGRTLHFYVDPEREIDAGALAVHGISNEDLIGKPRFADVADDVIDFISGAEIVIHNAPFDIGFLNAELALIARQPVHTYATITDSLTMARSIYPGKKNSLNALCERLGVDNTGRTYHGALLDAQLLADVYVAMTRGQDSLSMDFDIAAPISLGEISVSTTVHILLATEEEVTAHEAYLNVMAKKSQVIWRVQPQA